MNTRATLFLWALGSLLAGCPALGPTYDGTPHPLVAKPFGTIGDGVATRASYGDALGPRGVVWSDTLATGNAPSLVKTDRALADQPGVRPDVVTGGLAIYATTHDAALVAWDLVGNAEKWRVSDTRKMKGGTIVSNGTLVCGLTAEGESALLCLHVADGTEAWRTAPSWDLPAAFSGSPDFVFHGDTLFGAGAAKAYAWDLATGHERWTRKNAPAWRALIFLGDDLVMENSAACESTAASCFEALDPLTGEVKTTFPAKGGAAFLFAKGGVGYWLTPPKALFVGDQKIVRYDSATHAFSDATTDLAALADTIVPGEYAYGLTPTLADGGVYISHGAPPSVSVCRWDTTTLTKTWCAVTQGALGGIRVHPNVLFVTALYGGRAQGFKPSDGASPSVAFALWFEEFGFNGSSYGVLE